MTTDGSDDILGRIRILWDKNEFMGPSLDTPLICCLCEKELSRTCGVPDFRELCSTFKDSNEVLKMEYVAFAGGN